MGNDGFNPGFQRPQARVIFLYSEEHLQESIIQHCHRFHIVLAIALAYPVYDRIEVLIEQFLRFSIITPASLYPLIDLTWIQSLDKYFFYNMMQP